MTATALGQIPELLLESTCVNTLRPPTGEASSPFHAADPIAPWTTRVLRISHDLAPLCHSPQHPGARSVCGPMMVPPFVETLHLDSRLGGCWGWPHLHLPPSLRVLHIDLDQWIITEVSLPSTSPAFALSSRTDIHSLIPDSTLFMGGR